jgi:hypothetical protein
MSFRIESIHAFVSVDENGEEGVIASLGPNGVWTPLIAADEAKLEVLRPIAQMTARATGRPVHHLRFMLRDLVEIIDTST